MSIKEQFEKFKEKYYEHVKPKIEEHNFIEAGNVMGNLILDFQGGEFRKIREYDYGSNFIKCAKMFKDNLLRGEGDKGYVFMFEEGMNRLHKKVLRNS